MTSSDFGRAPAADVLPCIAVVVAAALQIMTPLLPSLGSGEPIGAQSDSVNTLITPAGWAFSIWGALYSGCILFAIYQSLPAQRESELVAQVRWPAAGAFLGNAIWAAYTQMFGLSAISAAIIIFTLACLLAIYRRFAAWQPGFSHSERWLVVLPLSALGGWLTVAAIVNIAAALRFHGIEGGDAAPAVGAVVLFVGGLIAGTALVRGQGNPHYAMVLVWGLAAIYSSGGQESGLIGVAAIIAGVIVIAGAIVGLRRSGTGRWFG